MINRVGWVAWISILLIILIILRKLDEKWKKVKNLVVQNLFRQNCL